MAVSIALALLAISGCARDPERRGTINGGSVHGVQAADSASRNVVEPPARPATPAPGVVAHVLGKDIERSQVGRGGLGPHILRPLFLRYGDEHKLSATAAEIRAFRKSMDREWTEEMATGMIEQWKIDRALYKQYGGDVIFQQMNPYEPVGAYRRFLEDEQKAERFAIYDKELEEKFWEYFRKDHQSWVVPPEDVNFEKPWWEQMKDRK
jgi:hypothetical protein